VDDDAIFRRNALNGLADRLAIVDALRRLPLVVHPQLGKVSLRDIDTAGGDAAGEGKGEAQVAAVFASVSSGELQILQQQAGMALLALKRIEARMREAGGSDVEPDFDPLNSTDSSNGPVGLLVQIDRIAGQHLAARGEGDSPVQDEQPGSAGAAGGAVAVGSIRTRQDAVRALDAVAAWFRQNEPSSPVPMFVERAKRLVSMSFLDILEDVAPDGVGQARSAGGVKADS
jgi:type VI secretion system protein ImpA